MCDETLSVGQEVEDFIKEVIEKHKLGVKPAITYNTGSEDGEGYLSRSFAVTISNEGKEALNVFVKIALNITAENSLIPFASFYANEIYFYDVIYPTYLKFLEDNKVSDGFRNVPKCYGTSPKNIIALENLKTKGYALFDNKKFMNEEQIELAFRTIAKFHAISFALKDQKREEYDKLLNPVVDINDHIKNESFAEARKEMVNDFLKCLDPIGDKHILETVGDLGDNLTNFLRNSLLLPSEYRILIQGDFWSNNVMFLYDDQNQEKPLDIMLIDWQMIRPSIPVHDLSFFFYNVASASILNKLNSFLKVYHDELSRSMKNLGSDSEVLFPFSILEKQWKEQGKYGYVMAFVSSMLILKEKDEKIFSFEEVDLENPESWKAYLKIKKHDEYIQRLKILTEHMIANDFL